MDDDDTNVVWLSDWRRGRGDEPAATTWDLLAAARADLLHLTPASLRGEAAKRLRVYAGWHAKAVVEHVSARLRRDADTFPTVDGEESA